MSFKISQQTENPDQNLGRDIKVLYVVLNLGCLYLDVLDFRDSFQVTLPERTIYGTYAARLDDLSTALDLMRSGRVDVTSWPTRYSLGNAVEAFNRMLRPGPEDFKAILMP